MIIASATISAKAQDLFGFENAISTPQQKYLQICDSLTKVVKTKEDRSAIILCTTIANALSSYVVNPEESFSVQKLNDSTLIASGIFKMRKHKENYSRVYGIYKISQSADGFISYKLFVQCKQGAFRYEYTNLNHYRCTHNYGRLCETSDDDKGSRRGLKIQFMERSDDQVDLMKKSIALGDW